MKLSNFTIFGTNSSSATPSIITKTSQFFNEIPFEFSDNENTTSKSFQENLPGIQILNNDDNSVLVGLLLFIVLFLVISGILKVGMQTREELGNDENVEINGWAKKNGQIRAKYNKNYSYVLIFSSL